MLMARSMVFQGHGALRYHDADESVKPRRDKQGHHQRQNHEMETKSAHILEMGMKRRERNAARPKWGLAKCRRFHEFTHDEAGNRLTVADQDRNNRMRTRFKLLLSLSLLAASAGAASAWTPPDVGRACHGTRGPGLRHEAIAGNFLGGRPIRNGLVDRKSFQSCFASVDRCEAWLAGKARQFPLVPGIATCTRVVVR